MQSQYRGSFGDGSPAKETEPCRTPSGHDLRLRAVLIALAMLLAVGGAGRSRVQAQAPVSTTPVPTTATPTPAPFATTVATISLADLAADPDLVFHGDAVRVSASQNGVPMAVGASFPTGEPPLDLDLAYAEPLPGNIPSAALLGVHHYGGASWSPISSALTPATDGGSFAVTVSRTGDYAIAAPALRIVVKPTAVTLRRGESVQFTAQVLDPEGQPQTGYAVTWQATSVAGLITPAGLFTATGKAGTYDGAVVASLGDIEGYADVTVAPWTNLIPLVLRGWEMQLRPNDPLYALQWNLVRIRAPQAWATTTGGPVIVAVIDSGADLSHPDLQPNLISGRRFGSTYPDSCPVPSQLPQDDNGHGTHVSGIIAAAGNNALGVTGTAWTARIMPLKVLDCNGNGYVSDAVLAIKWAADLDAGVRIINLSIGTPATSGLKVFEEAVRYAQDRNILVVAAAGNIDDYAIKPGTVVYPAAFSGVVGVGSTDSGDRLAYYSSQGFWVDVVAPGQSVYSTVLRSAYGFMNGTSMATPHVSGVAALLWSRYPQLAATQVAAIIRGSAKDLGAPGYDEAYGWGRLDAFAAMELAPETISATVAEPEAVALAESPADAPLAAAGDPTPFRPGYLIVQAEPGAVTAAQLSMPGRIVALSTEDLLPGWSLVRVPDGQEAAVRAQLSGQPGVHGVYFDAQVHAMD